MPNWVNTVIEFDGAKENIAAVFKEIAGEDEQNIIDFNKLIPMPESLNVTSGSDSNLAYAYYCVKEFNRMPDGKFFLKDSQEVIDRVEKSPYEDAEKMMEFGRLLHDNKERYGALTWYEWCINNWGTKWNACNCVQTDRTIELSTAWDWPEPIMEKLAEVCMKLDVSFSGEWADEDCGRNTGCFSCDESGLRYDGYRDCSEEAYKAYERCFGDIYSEIDIDDFEQSDGQTRNNDIQMG